MSRARSAPSYVPAIAALAVAIATWEAVSLNFLPILVPGPVDLIRRMVEVYSDPKSYLVVGTTLLRIAEGLVLSMFVGGILGFAMGLRRNIELFFDSWIMVLLSFPAVCWAFLGVLWFGLSSTAPILTIVLIVFPFVALNIWGGTKAIESTLIDMARVYKADRSLMVRKVLIPQLMPYVFSSLRIALSLSWKIALVGEAFGVGSGVGQQLVYWFQETRIDMMLAWGVSFMIVMLLIDVVVFRLWERRTFRWRHQFAT